MKKLFRVLAQTDSTTGIRVTEIAAANVRQ